MPLDRRWQVAAVAAVALGLAAWWLTPEPEPLAQPAAQVRGHVPQRVVTMSPAITEAVFAVGGGPQVIAVSDFTTWPPEAAALPSCGAFINPNLERLTELRPDLIVFQGRNETLRRHCEGVGLTYAAYEMDTIEDLLAMMRDVAARLGRAVAGKREADRVAHELAAVRAAVAGGPRVPTFLCVGRQAGRLAGLMTAGPRTFLNQVLELAGGRNVFADTELLYPSPSLEALTQRAPEVILELRPGEALDADGIAALQRDWSLLPALPAVRSGRITVLTDDYLMLPSPRVVLTARRFAAALHPTVALPEPTSQAQ